MFKKAEKNTKEGGWLCLRNKTKSLWGVYSSANFSCTNAIYVISKIPLTLTLFLRRYCSRIFFHIISNNWRILRLMCDAWLHQTDGSKIQSSGTFSWENGVSVSSDNCRAERGFINLQQFLFIICLHWIKEMPYIIINRCRHNELKDVQCRDIRST